MDRTVLVTGVTGFLGGALAARLTTSGTRVVAIVRATDGGHARDRVVRSLARFLGATRAETAAHGVEVLIGDLASDDTYDHSALECVTHVIHAAACTSFVSKREVWRSNVDATMKLAERTRRLARLRRFVHVSTAYCCGDRPGRVVREDDSPRTQHGYVNEYSRSKAAAETLLTSMGWDGRLVVARPSVVIGHTKLGARPSGSLLWYYRALAALRCGPFDLQDRRDIVPVDYVAEAIDFLSRIERTIFGTYHVSAGERASVTLAEIVAQLDESRATRLDWRRISARELGASRLAISKLTTNAGEAEHLARGLEACARFGELGVQWFDNARLLSEGFRPPPRFTDYLGVCIESSAGKPIHRQMLDDA
jgi:nucleoside-diphosphate-sugar epimerase